MPEQEHTARYDLAVLQPLLDQGYTILTPTVRLARRIRQEFNLARAHSGLTAWEPPAITSLDAFLQQCWRDAAAAGSVQPRRLLSTQQQSELWRQVIVEDLEERGEAALLQPGPAADLAREARETLLRWRVDASNPAIVADFQADTDCVSFYRWLRRFEGLLAARSMATAADLLDGLLGTVPAKARPSAALLDFDDVPPLQQACLEHLCAEVRRVSGARTEAMLEVRAFTDREAELQAVAGWAAAQHRAAPRRDLGIILADPTDRGRLEYLLRREFDCLGQNYTALPVNFSTGITLERAPVVRDALLALATVGDSMPLNELLALLRSRFVAGADALDDALVSVLRRLYRDGRRDVALARLRFLCQKEVASRPAAAQALLATEALRLRRQRMLPSAWATAFSEVLNAWGWPGTRPLDSLEYQQVELWYATLEDLAGYDEFYGELDITAANALLRRLCQAQISQPQTADTAIQVLGPLEGAGLHFEHVWWVGLQGSRWPAAPRPNPFLPLGLQRRHDMPHASSEREWQYAQALLNRYRGASPQLTVSYARHIEGVPDLPSPLVSDATRVDCDEPPALPADWTARQAAVDLTASADHAGPPVDDDEREQVSGGSAILTAQAACPFQGFAAHRLRLEPLQAAVRGLSAAERGKLLHEALFALWGAINDSRRLQQMDTGALHAAIAAAVETAIAELPTQLRLMAGSHCIDLERQRLQSLLQEWLALERQREPFTVTAREQQHSLELRGLPLTLRIDRIDAVDGGGQLLIDYKSGRCRLGDWLGERLRDPQLPLYSVVADVAGIAFAQVRPRDCKFVGLATVPGTPGVAHDLRKALARYAVDIQDWAELVAHWRSDLEQLAGDFLAGKAAVEPQPRACDYCAYPALCRVGLGPGEAG